MSQDGSFFGRGTLPVRSFLKDYWSRLKMFSRNIRLLLLGFFLSGLGMTFWNLLFNLYLQEAGYSKEFIGGLLSYGGIAVAAVALPAGYLAGRIDLRILVVVMLTLANAAFTAAIQADGPVQILAFTICGMALGTFVRIASGPFIMRNSTPVERTYIFSVMFIIMLAGGVIGNAMGGFIKDGLLDAGFPPLAAYRTTILFGIAFSFSGALPFFMLKTDAAGSGAVPPISLANFRTWNWSLFGRAILAQTPLSVGAGLIVQFMNLYFQDVFNTDAKTIGLLMSAQASTMVVGIMAAPALSERLGKVKTIIFSQAASIPFMLVLAFTNNLALAGVAFIVRAALMNMSAPISNTLILELCPKQEQGRFNALENVIWSLAWALSAYIYGHVFNADYELCFVVAAGLYVCSSGLFYLFFRNAEKQTSTSSEIAQV